MPEPKEQYRMLVEMKRNNPELAEGIIDELRELAAANPGFLKRQRADRIGDRRVLDWANADNIEDRYWHSMKACGVNSFKKDIWHYRQNYPETIVTDIMSFPIFKEDVDKELDRLMDIICNVAKGGVVEDDRTMAEVLEQDNRVIAAMTEYIEYVERMRMTGMFASGIQKDRIRDFLFSVLLRRGVNKWFMVRQMLIRYKKWAGEESKRYSAIADDNRGQAEGWRVNARGEVDEGKATRAHVKANRHWSKYHYYRGMACGYNKVRYDLKTMCMGPRWVIWNYKHPGLFDMRGMKEGFKAKFVELWGRLMNYRFRK